jgi:hypothetical protein
MRRLYMIAGSISVFCGAFLICWMAYGFASMVDPDLRGDARRAEILTRLFTDGAGTVGFAILLIGAGVYLARIKPKPAS